MEDSEKETVAVFGSHQLWPKVSQTFHAQLHSTVPHPQTVIHFHNNHNSAVSLSLLKQIAQGKDFLVEYQLNRKTDVVFVSSAISPASIVAVLTCLLQGICVCPLPIDTHSDTLYTLFKATKTPLNRVVFCAPKESLHHHDYVLAQFRIVRQELTNDDSFLLFPPPTCVKKLDASVELSCTALLFFDPVSLSLFGANQRNLFALVNSVPFVNPMLTNGFSGLSWLTQLLPAASVVNSSETVFKVVLPPQQRRLQSALLQQQPPSHTVQLFSTITNGGAQQAARQNPSRMEIQGPACFSQQLVVGRTESWFQLSPPEFILTFVVTTPSDQQQQHQAQQSQQHASNKKEPRGVRSVIPRVKPRRAEGSRL